MARRTIRTRRNPLGRPAKGYVIVRLGKGQKTHIYDPKSKAALCQSGKHAGKHSPDVEHSGVIPEVFRSEAAFATCERCQKLAAINEKKNADGSLLPEWKRK